MEGRWNASGRGTRFSRRNACFWLVYSPKIPHRLTRIIIRTFSDTSAFNVLTHHHHHHSHHHRHHHHQLATHAIGPLFDSFRSHTSKSLFSGVPWFLQGRDSSVGIATRYGLDGPGIESRWGARFSAPLQTGPRSHPVSYIMATRSFQGVKRPGRGVNHPPPFSAEVK